MTSPKPEEPLPLTDADLAKHREGFARGYPDGIGRKAWARLLDHIDWQAATIAHHKARADKAELARFNDRELLVRWMMDHSYATGHGDDIAELLEELEPQHKARADTLAAQAAAIRNAALEEAEFVVQRRLKNEPCTKAEVKMLEGLIRRIRSLITADKQEGG